MSGNMSNNMSKNMSNNMSDAIRNNVRNVRYVSGRFWTSTLRFCRASILSRRCSQITPPARAPMMLTAARERL
eukprot:6244108-Prymnesium_polylepis.1